MAIKKDRRLRRRNEAARMVETPEEIEITRRPRGERPSEAMKAAVLASLMLGMKPSRIALQYGLNAETVKRWESEFDITNPIERQGRLGEMFLTFLEQELTSLVAISIATSDEEWIQEQPAGELAVLISAKTDRVMKLLEALGRKSEPAPQKLQVIEADD